MGAYGGNGGIDLNGLYCYGQTDASGGNERSGFGAVARQYELSAPFKDFLLGSGQETVLAAPGP